MRVEQARLLIDIGITPHVDSNPRCPSRIGVAAVKRYATAFLPAGDAKKRSLRRRVGSRSGHVETQPGGNRTVVVDGSPALLGAHARTVGLVHDDEVPGRQLAAVVGLLQSAMRACPETIYRALFAGLLGRRDAKLRTGRTRLPG
ncbi:hypothetical protein [Streptomyces sp. NPDC087437]|uniref:hypothetical protein n=1 Tax=Streptomyces sp. NPDC087437 TaxID=3365789 RepID=UPI003812FBF2